jgi:hypothetical protein
LLLLALCIDMPEKPAPSGVSCIGKRPTVGKTLLSIFCSVSSFARNASSLAFVPWDCQPPAERHFTGVSVE